MKVMVGSSEQSSMVGALVGALGSGGGATSGTSDGFPVGEELGLAEGATLGLVVGLPVETEGAAVGVAVGLEVGEAFGEELGLVDGLDVGVTLGEELGLRVGLFVGKALGVELGLALGNGVGTGFGGMVGLALGEALGLPLGDVLGEELGLLLGATLGESLGLALGEAVGNALGCGLIVGAIVGSRVSLGGALPIRIGVGVANGSRQTPNPATAPFPLKRMVNFVTLLTCISTDWTALDPMSWKSSTNLLPPTCSMAISAPPSRLKSTISMTASTGGSNVKTISPPPGFDTGSGVLSSWTIRTLPRSAQFSPAPLEVPPAPMPGPELPEHAWFGLPKLVSTSCCESVGLVSRNRAKSPGVYPPFEEMASTWIPYTDQLSLLT
jgi:hypothetical protein